MIFYTYLFTINRHNVVITTQKDYDLKCLKSVSFNTIDDAVEHLVLEKKYETCWVIGGSAIYNHFIEKSLCDRIYLTKIENNFQCDRFFPQIELTQYKEVQEDDISSDQQVENGVKYSYHIYEKI